ncbi:MAG: hypothetical protein KDA41_22325, partial [Planctomycetales bacterium]|nr:hypothetical protein [Planctomycetales bacterium]
MCCNMLSTSMTRVFALLAAVVPCAVSAAEKVSFNDDIRPILSNHCFTCHGPDSTTREANLRLDQRDSAIGKAESGLRAIVPGDVAASELIRRVSAAADDDERMPPVDGAKPLTPQQIAMLKSWIEQGAEYQPHWA